MTPRLAALFEGIDGLTRSDGPEGTKPLLPKWHRQRLTTFLERCPDETRAALLSLFDGIGPDRPVARGLLLRGLSAQLSRIDSGTPVDEALLDLVDQLVQGSDDDLRRRATVIDLDSSQSTSDFDILTITERRGVIYEPDTSTRFADNDGLFQRFTAACGPTVLQMMIAEVDPAIAFEIHAAGLDSDASTDPPARFQRRLLEQYGGVAIGRREAQLRARVRNALGRLARTDDVSGAALTAFRTMVEERGPHNKPSRQALAAMRKRFGGFPSGDELRRLRRAAPIPDRDVGIDAAAFSHALDTLVTPISGVRYRKIGNRYGIKRGQTWRYLDQIIGALKLGIDIPVGTAEPSHWMLLTHAAGRRPNRRLLLSDPEGGRTAWVHERDFVKGTFMVQQFYLSTSGESGYIDCIFMGGA